MEPVTAVTTALTIAGKASDVSKKLYALANSLKDRDAKRQVEEIQDQLRELKQSASEIEDQNRDLREKLRFKSDDYVFRTPFRYHKDRPDVPLCVKCFAANVEAPMGEPGVGVSPGYRHCLVCGNNVAMEKSFHPSPRIASDAPHFGR